MRTILARSHDGHNLVAALMVTVLLGALVLSYVFMVGGRSTLRARLQTGNRGASAEASVRETLAHLNKKGIIPAEQIELTANLDAPGWALTDGICYYKRSGGGATLAMPNVEMPYQDGLTPMSGWVGTNHYDYILNEGDYELKRLSGLILVAGTARLLVKNRIDFKAGATDPDGIVFASESSLEIWMDGKETVLTGKQSQTILSPGEQLGFNFFYFGGPKNERVELVKMDGFAGIVYAPSAKVFVKGGNHSHDKAGFHGAILGDEVTLEPTLNDEAPFPADTTWRNPERSLAGRF